MGVNAFTFPLPLTLPPRGEGMNGSLRKFLIWHYVHLVVVFSPSYLASHHRVRFSVDNPLPEVLNRVLHNGCGYFNPHMKNAKCKMRDAN